MTSEVFPNSLKVTSVIPIFMTSDKKIMSIYRPISILALISKKFGFQKGKSCADAVGYF